MRLAQAYLSVRLKVGGGLGRDKALTRPADILVSNPSGSASAAYDITVTSPLNPPINLEAGVSAGTAAKAAEVRKHSIYDVKCSEHFPLVSRVGSNTYNNYYILDPTRENSGKCALT